MRTERDTKQWGWLIFISVVAVAAGIMRWLYPDVAPEDNPYLNTNVEHLHGQ